jgi:Protein of unknown function (DUF3999)
VAAVAFSHERAVTPGASGANRLDVDVALLAGAQPDLRDLRLVDAQQREVGYLLVTPKGEPRWLDGRVLSIRPTKFTSGWEINLGRAANVDRVKLDGITPPYLKRVTVEGSGDRTRWTLLADATVFDLPENELRRTEIAFQPGQYRYLRLVWDDRSSARVASGAVHVREHDSAARPEPMRFTTAFAKRTSEPGKSRYRIRLPGKRLPLEAIEVEVAGGNVFRAAQVTEPQFQHGRVLPATLGRAELKRAERGGIVAAEMAVPIDAPAGRELDLEITDGSNPPLAITAIRARLKPQPWIYFESTDGAPLHVRYGNASAAKPLYDLEASRKYIDSKNIATAEWTGEQAIPPVQPKWRTSLPLGATIDRDRFRFSRRVPDAPPGLSVLLLDAHALSYAHGDVAQMRIVDGSGRQVPYLLETRAEGPTVKIAIPPRRVEGTRSVYRLTLPYNQLRNEGLVLTTSARVFERTVTLRRASRDHRWRTGEEVRTAEWRSADPDDAAPPLHIDLPAGAPRAMDLILDEGDNAPLPVASAHLLLPPLALRFDHPGKPLFLLYGNKRVSEPRYDVALLAPRLFGEPARELTLPPPVGLRAADDDRQGRKFFWIGVVIAGVVLIAMLLRVLLVSPETSRAPSDTT